MNGPWPIVAGCLLSTLLLGGCAGPAPMPGPRPLRLVIAHHMNAEPPIKAGGQNALGVGSNTPGLPWEGADANWSEIGGRTRDMSLTTLYGVAGQTLRQQAAWEIAVAQRAGVDAFAFYGGVPGGEGRVLEYMRAAKVAGFKITLCSGGGERGDKYDEAAASLRRLVAADRELGTLLRVDGKLLLLTYGGNWGDTVEEMLAKRRDLERRVGTPMLVMYAPFGLTTAGHIRPEQRAGIYAGARERLGALLDGGFDGLSPFMVSSGDRVEADLRFYAEVCRDHGKLYFQPVNFQFHSPKYMTHAPVADETWNRSWAVAHDAADGVQLVTWNDWGETTALAPGVGSNYGLYDLLREETAAFKAGRRPPIRNDRAWVMYYRYPSTCEPQLYQPPSPRQFRGREHDRIWVRTELTAPSTVMCEGHGEQAAPAGRSLVSFPLTPGPVRITIRRQGRAVLTLSPPEVVTDRPWRPDHSLVAFASDDRERAYRAADFPGQEPRFYSEFGDDDSDGLLNWFEGLYFSTLEQPSTPVGPADNFNGIPCATAQRECRDPIEPIRDDPVDPPVIVDLSHFERNLARAVWRERYRWGEASLRPDADGLTIYNPGDQQARELFAFYDTVPNATYGPLCRWGNATVTATVRFDYGDQPASAWGNPSFALTTRIAPGRRAMYFLRLCVSSAQEDPATARLSLGWMRRVKWEPAQEVVFAETALPLAADGTYRLSLTAETVGADTVRLTGVCRRPGGAERWELHAERSMTADETTPRGEVGFSTEQPAVGSRPETPGHILLKEYAITAIKR